MLLYNHVQNPISRKGKIVPKKKRFSAPVLRCMPSSAQQERFSTGLRITELDDFLPSSTECILPIQGGAIPAGSVAAPVYGSHANGEGSGSAVARVTLSDCLSCSGCITSAETILLSTHSIDSFLAACCERVAQIGVVAVAPAVLALLASAWQVDELKSVLERLQQLFDKIGTFFVVTNGAGRYLSVLETCAQAAERLQRDANGELVSRGPLFASACPGWTFYVEKTQEHIVPNLSTAKSPQAMMASLARYYFGTETWFVSIAPCFDKKLESQRETLKKDGTFVLTTSEILELDKRFEMATCIEPKSQVTDSAERPELVRFQHTWTTFGGLSGGYAVEVFRYVTKHVFHYRIEDEDLHLAAVRDRNPDLQQLLLYENCSNGTFSVARQPIADSKDVRLRYAVATAYGFRNIQNIVRRLKATGDCTWNFVEVMACPGGCGNGGGQWFPAEPLSSGPTQRMRRQQVHQLEKSSLRLPQYHVDAFSDLVTLWAKWRATTPELVQVTFVGRRDSVVGTNRNQNSETVSERLVADVHRVLPQW
jgi:iron only hydrogenase large subunit-like protein